MPNLLLDTGAGVALLNREEKDRSACAEFFGNFRGRLFSTEPVLTESLYLLRDSFDAQKKCLLFFLGGVQLAPCNTKSLTRSLALMEQYQDTPMDFADATLVALAEEISCGEIFTLDHRGFETYRWGRHRVFKIYTE